VKSSGGRHTVDVPKTSPTLLSIQPVVSRRDRIEARVGYLRRVRCGATTRRSAGAGA